MNLYSRLFLQKPLLTLLVFLLGVVWMASHVGNVKLDASSDSLVLEGDESLAYFREIGKRYASEDFLVVTYKPKNEKLFSESSLQRLSDLREDLLTLPGVSSVNSVLDVPLLESPKVTLTQVAAGNLPTLRDPDVDRAEALIEFTNSSLYKNLLTSQDGTITMLQVNLQRDETYVALQDQRDALLAQRRDGSLDAAGEQALADAELAFDLHKQQSAEQMQQLVAEARVVLDAYRGDVEMFLGGVPMIANDMLEFVQNDLYTFGLGIIAFIVVLLAVIFRRLLWIVLPLSTCLLTLAFMLGLLGFLDWRMTVISSNFVALLLIITLSISIHLVVRYRELAWRMPDAEQIELVREVVAQMARPCIYTALTTLVAFASLVISGIRPVIDFGWMMVVGVSVALMFTFIFIPSAMALMRAPLRELDRDNSQGFTLRFADIAKSRPAAIFVVSLAVLAAAITGISMLKVENRFIDYFDDSTEIYRGMETVDAKLGGTIPLEIIIDKPQPKAPVVPAFASSSEAPENAADFADDEFAEDADAGFGGFGAASAGFAEDEYAQDEYAEDADAGFGGGFAGGFDEDYDEDFGGGFAPAASTKSSYWFTIHGMRQVAAVHDYLDAMPETGKVLSIATLYEVIKLVMGEGVDDLELSLAKKAMGDEIGDILVSPYLKDDIDQTRMVIRVKETSRTLQRNELLKKIEADMVNELGFEPGQVKLTGMLVLYNNMLQSLFRSQILTISAVFFAILLMFMLLFRSLQLALIALAPNMLAAGAVLGGMGLAGIPLDMMTITIAAITVGIGVDHAIHYVHRFRSEFPKDRDYVQTMYRCHGSIGKAMYYTSVIIIFGFSILALSNFNPSIYFGLLTAGAMFAALMGSMLLLPRLILLVKPLGK